MPERSQHRVSGAQDGRSERPAMGHGWPEAGLGERSRRPRVTPYIADSSGCSFSAFSSFTSVSVASVSSSVPATLTAFFPR